MEFHKNLIRFVFLCATRKFSRGSFGESRRARKQFFGGLHFWFTICDALIASKSVTLL
jgi:hypothetical protein